ncbi:MAG: hypothetical protein E7152_15515 [Enterococcus casseliflavus]|nr:hypothetical protein [Enterococcus casseliflavus]
MLYPEFKKYLEENADGYKMFIEKALENEKAKNKKRQPAKRWNDAKLEKSVNDSWKQVSLSAYNQIRPHVGVPKYNGKEKWIDFMDENNFIEMFNDGIAEMEFDQE